MHRYKSTVILPKRVATHARIASRAAVLSPGEGREECWGKQTVSLSHSASLCFSFSPARAPPLRQGHTDTVTVPVLVKPETPSLKTKGTYRVREEDAERDRVCKGDVNTKLAVGPKQERETDNNSKEIVRQNKKSVFRSNRAC